MKRAIHASIALAVLSGCTTIGPRPGETPCDYGRRVMAEAQRRLDQAQSATASTCAMLELRQ